jgi:hypothetical protein
MAGDKGVDAKGAKNGKKGRKEEQGRLHSCSALSTQHSALSTQHSALSTQHSALRPITDHSFHFNIAIVRSVAPRCL